jgi:hypothetical protein
MSLARRIALPLVSIAVIAVGCGGSGSDALFSSGSGGVGAASGGDTSAQTGGTNGSSGGAADGGFTSSGGTSPFAGGISSVGGAGGIDTGTGGFISSAGGTLANGGFAGASGAAATGGTGDGSAPPAGDVACGATPCPASTFQGCCYKDTNAPICYGGLGSTCTCGLASQCTTAVQVECDGPEDCRANEVCCAEMNATDTVYTRLQCLISCKGILKIQRTEICHPGSGTCTNGNACASDPLLPAAYGDCG